MVTDVVFIELLTVTCPVNVVVPVSLLSVKVPAKELPPSTVRLPVPPNEKAFVLLKLRAPLMVRFGLNAAVVTVDKRPPMVKLFRANGGDTSKLIVVKKPPVLTLVGVLNCPG